MTTFAGGPPPGQGPTAQNMRLDIGIGDPRYKSLMDLFNRYKPSVPGGQPQPGMPTLQPWPKPGEPRKPSQIGEIFGGIGPATTQGPYDMGGGSGPRKDPSQYGPIRGIGLDVPPISMPAWPPKPMPGGGPVAQPMPWPMPRPEPAPAPGRGGRPVTPGQGQPPMPTGPIEPGTNWSDPKYWNPQPQPPGGSTMPSAPPAQSPPPQSTGGARTPAPTQPSGPVAPPQKPPMTASDPYAGMSDAVKNYYKNTGKTPPSASSRPVAAGRKW